MKNKKLSLIIFTLFTVMAFIPNLFADTINVNDKVIYEDGIKPNIIETVTFDETTNTLTLNGYDGGEITFKGFNDKTINVVLKGTNRITTTDENDMLNSVPALGFIDESNCNINITGENDSTIYLNGYYNGIYANHGSLYLDNVNITGENIQNVLVYSYYGSKVSIKNSNITASEIDYVLANDNYDMDIDNVKLVANNIYSTIAYLAGDLTITKSNFDFNIECTGFVAGNLNMKNSNIKSTGGYLISIDYNATLENVDINAKQAGLILAADYTYIKNSNIKAVDSVNEDELITIDEEMTVTNSKMDLQSDSILIYGYGKLTLNNSDVTLISTSSPALLFGTDDELKEFSDLLILNDVVLKENNLIKRAVLYGSGIGYNYSYFTEEPKSTYELEEIEDSYNIMARQLHFTAKYSVTFDANGGSGNMNNIYTTGTLTLPENEFTAPNGKVFKGWSLTKNGSIITKVNVNKNIKVYAIWENETNNPQTLDNTSMYIVLLITSLFGLLLTTKVLKKQN